MSTVPLNPRRTLAACLSLAALSWFHSAPAAAQSAAGCGRNPELISCAEDASTAADRQELQRMVDGMFRPLADEAFSAGEIGIRYLGKVRQMPEAQFPANEPQEPASTRYASPRSREVAMFRAISPGSGNEFEIEVPRPIRDAFDRLMASTGASLESRGSLNLRDAREGGPIPQAIGKSGKGSGTPVANAFSGGNDSRTVGANPSTVFPWVAVANIGRCTATFVGPRHLVTAAHCLYNRTSASFSSQYTIQPGRDSVNVPYQTTIPGSQGTGKSWIFVPPQFMQANPSGGVDQYDFGIMVTPDRLANEFGYLGYGTLASGSLRDRNHLVRGYPLCESETGNPATATNPERIDEPTPCAVNDFFVGDSCTVGSFSVPDGDGWSRRVTHGCDASAGNSGSAVYSYVDGYGAFVSMIHTRSLKCAFAGNAACTAADTHPLEATRITPEYSGWVSWFRNAWQ